MMKTLVSALVCLALTACESPSPRPEVSPSSLGGLSLEGLSLDFEIIDNHHGGSRNLRAAWTLLNHGDEALGNQGWEIYFNFGRMILPESLPSSIQAFHINGDFFKLTPTEDFPTLEPGESLRIPFEARGWAIKAGDAPSGAYLVRRNHPNPNPVEIPILVAPLETPQQTRRMADDEVPVPTPASTYELNQALTPLDAADIPRLLPTPIRLRVGDGQITLDAAWRIHYDPGLDAEAEYLAANLEPVLGTSLEKTVEAGASPEGRSITLRSEAFSSETEAYRLTIDEKSGIKIVGTDAAGVFHGIQSLRALMPVFMDEVTIDEVTIEDAPRFAYRGLHLDVARNFQSKKTVLKLLDLMAIYKLNRFHFHLADDEGWRLEIPALPELTEVGGRRGHTTDETDRLVPSWGSGPDPEHSHGSGSYTRADFVEILRFADARHIEVIPEIDVPGHARAAIKAMEARADPATLLSEEGDASEYRSVQMWTDNVVNVCLPSTYTFLRTVIGEIVDQYAEAGVPLTTLRTGGDEVPHGVWEKSPACERLIHESEEVNSVDDLPGYFLRKISGILSEAGLITAGWEEIALIEEKDGEETTKTVNPAFVDRRFQPYVWNNVWGWGAEDLGYRLANAGYDIVLSNATNLYFDLAYNKDPREPGQYWAGLIDTRKPYEFVPLDLFKNARHDLMGRPLPPDKYADSERLTADGRRHVLGIQGQIWAEYARGQAMMEYLAFPKVLGLAERAWAAQPAWARVEDAVERERRLADDWNAFAHRLGHHELPRLDRLHGGVAYRLPTPGAIVEGGELFANVAFPGLEIRYTTDGSEPTRASTLYTGPVVAQGTVVVQGTVRLKSFDRRGRGSLTAVLLQGVVDGSTP